MSAITLQELEEAQVDSTTIEKFANGTPQMVVPRYGAQFPNIPKIVNDFKADAADVLRSTGFEAVNLTYTPGTPLVVDRPTQLIVYNGAKYSITTPANFPVTLTGVWATDLNKLTERGDGPLRQQLADPTFPQSVVVARAIRHINGLGELQSVAGRYNNDVSSLAGVVGLNGKFIWVSNSTAAANGRDIFQVAGVNPGRWVRDVTDMIQSTASAFTAIGNEPLAEILRLQAMFKAETIRRAAGCQPWVVLGPFDETMVGQRNDVARVNSAVISITSAASAAALAGSGTGTQADPYVIKNRNITFSSGNPAILLNDAAATYYVAFDNIRPSGTSNGSAIINAAAFGTPVSFTRCGFAGAGGLGDEIAVNNTAVTLNFYSCAFTGISGQVFVGSGLTKKTINLFDCIVSGNSKTSSTNGVFWAGGAGDFSVSAQRCGFKSTHFHWHIGNGWTIDYTLVENCYITGCAVGIGDLNYLKPGGNILSQIPNMIRNSVFRNVKFTFTSGVTQTHCYGNGADNCVFENCSFEGNVADRRLFEWRRTSNIKVYRCFFQKLLGSNTAGNEVCEFWESAGVTIQECWANGAPEDCYEIVSSYGRNRLIDNVADNVAGQCVDIFGVGSFDVEVDGVYGDCGDAAVLITDVDYVRVKNVFVKQTGTTALGSVVLERRNAAPGVSPKGCSITGLLSLPEVCSQNKPFAVDTRYATAPGDIGANFATWWENGELKIFGPTANPARLTIR